MFTTRWRLFHLLGIPIYVDASWLLILALVTWTLSQFFAREIPGLEPAGYWLIGLVTALTFFGCIILHEMGHAVAARRLGMPIRGITLFMFGGVAELGGEPPSARSEFIMAIAGPVVSAILAGLFWLGATYGATAGWDLTVVDPLAYLAWINFIVLLFNMIPAFPTDGGRVLRSALWGVTGNLRRATRVASGIGQVFAWFLIGLGVLQFFAGNFFGGLWMGLIGLFLNNAARGGYEYVLVRQALQGEPVRHFMNTEPITVHPWVDLRTWVEDFVYRYHRKAFPVVTEGKLEGVITTRALAQFPRESWEQHTVAEAMDPDWGRASIPPDTDALDALARMQNTGYSRLLVTEGDQLVGIISLKDLMRFLQLRLELEGDDRDEPGSAPRLRQEAEWHERQRSG